MSDTGCALPLAALARGAAAAFEFRSTTAPIRTSLVAVGSDEDDEDDDEDEDEDEDADEDENVDETDAAAGRSQHATVPSSAPDATKTPLCAYATRGTSSGSVMRLAADTSPLILGLRF